MASPVTLVIEGVIDSAVARRLLGEVGLAVAAEHGGTGKATIDRYLRGYNNAARFSCWLVLRDLDHDAGCAPALRARLLDRPAAHMRLHVAVRAVEAWLLADGERISAFLRVTRTLVPGTPERLDDPKRTLVALARRSRSRAIREAMVPAPGATAAVGPDYASFLVDYASSHWRPEVAEQRSEDLGRLRRHLLRAARSTS